MKRIENKRLVLPNFFTVMNMFCGFFAIVKILQKNFVIGSWLIILASLFDALDGKMARYINKGSKFGIEFDSMADFISFGAAPSILIYLLYLYEFENLGIFLSFIPLVCGGFRLARFNITPVFLKKDSFIGLPIPLYAITISSFVILNYDLWNTMKLNHLSIPMILILSILMISKVKYEKLPQFKFTKNKGNNIKIILVFISFIIISLFKGKAIFPLMVILILFGIVKWLINLAKNPEEDKVADTSTYE
jgi:CDP-diacylglycerol--serine O-phosphatidyltransferase